MIECIKCYHLKRTDDNAVYCAHIHINPCYRGVHRPPSTLHKVVVPIAPKLTKTLYIPPFIPCKRGKTDHDWEKHHETVFKLHAEGYTDNAIGKKIGGVPAATVNKYRNRYRR